MSSPVLRHVRETEHDRQVKCSREHRPFWAVIQRHGNASAFNGYHWQYSAYSSVFCRLASCGRYWRTKAVYVEQLPDWDGTYIPEEGERNGNEVERQGPGAAGS